MSCIPSILCFLPAPLTCHVLPDCSSSPDQKPKDVEFVADSLLVAFCSEVSVDCALHEFMLRLQPKKEEPECMDVRVSAVVCYLDHDAQHTTILQLSGHSAVDPFGASCCTACLSPPAPLHGPTSRPPYASPYSSPALPYSRSTSNPCATVSSLETGRSLTFNGKYNKDGRMILTLHIARAP